MPKTEGRSPQNLNRNWLGEVRTSYDKRSVPQGTPFVPPWFKHYYLQIERDIGGEPTENFAELVYSVMVRSVMDAKNCDSFTASELVQEAVTKKPSLLKQEVEYQKETIYRQKTQPIFMSGELYNLSRMVLTPQDYAMYTKGTTKKKKNYYASWDGKYSLMTMSVYEAPFIRFEGDPGGGKSSGMTMVMEEGAWRFNAWIRSNIPIPAKRLYGKQLNSKVITDLGDLFIDDPPGSSIFWATTEGVWVLVGVDEHGMALEGYSQSQISSLYEELFWLRRHLKVIFYSTGVSSLPPKIEQYVTKKVLCQSKNYGERKHFNAKREFRWKVQKKISDEKYHEEEVVYRIPPPEITPEWGNDNEMAGPMGMGISIKNLLQSIDTSAPAAQMAAEADFYVRFWREADNYPVSEEEKKNKAAVIQAAFQRGLSEIRRRHSSQVVTSDRFINQKGYPTKIFYECLDCDHRWLFVGGNKPQCASCRSYNVKDVHLSSLTVEEFNEVESIRSR